MPRPRLPHPLVLLVACIAMAAVLTYLLPAGRFERRDDAATGRSVVVAGTYAAVEQTPVTPFAALVAIPRGMADAASVIFFVFLVGGAFAVVEATGALRRTMDWVLRALGGRETLVIPLAAVVFGLGGILIQMQEELLAFVPILLLLCRRCGFDRLTAVAMSLGAAAVGAAFSPVNPFQVQIAQKVAEVPVGSGMLFRLAFLAPAMLLWIWLTTRHARRTRTAPDAAAIDDAAGTSWRHTAVLLVVLAAFAVFAGGLRSGWDFEALGALFFVMGVAAGLVGGLRVEGTAAEFVEGFRSMAYAAMLIGFARAIYIVLDQGQIIDTIVSGVFAPLARLPLGVSAAGMMALQAAIHVPVPSTSGQAVLTLPVLVPLSDLLGMSRQITVLAYQYGAGLCELLTPTNGALMAMIAAAGVRYEEWARFAWPAVGLLALLGLAALGTGIGIGLQ